VRYAAAAILSLIITCIAIAQVQPRIAGEIKNDARVKIEGTAPRLISHSVDTGRLAGEQSLGHMVLMLSPSAAQEAAVKQFVGALHDPSSPSFHKWLTPSQFGEKFGVAEEDASRVQQWLESQGFTVHQVANSRRFIEFSGSVQQVEQAFSTEMHSYTRNGNGFIANSREISIPTALAPVVKGVVRLHSDPRSSQAYVGGKVHYDSSTHQFDSISGQHYMTPADFAVIYNLKPLYQAGIDGTGQTIAIVGRSNIDVQNVRDYRRLLGLPANDPQVIVNGDNPGQTYTDMPEAMLDVTWSGAVAPKAKIVFVVSQSNFADGVDVSASYIVDHNLAPIMSTSYGLCESGLGPVGNAFYYALWQQAAAQGITSFVSSGDNGGAGCDDPGSGLYAFGGDAVNGIASTPYNVAVGGTEFDDSADPSVFWNTTNDPLTGASALTYIPEKVWNQSSNDPNAVSLWAGSGGVSSQYAKPAWQSAPGVPADGKRDLPDLSLTASTHDGYLVCMFGYCSRGEYFYYFGGTSASAPSAAGIMALVNQKLGGQPQGLANYVLYRLASTPGVYHDTTTGNNKVPDGSGQFTVGYDAAVGYDLATGLGSVDANALVNKWSAAATGNSSAITLALAPGQAPTAVHGSSVMFQATVNCSGSGCTPAVGDVALQATSSSGSSLGVGAGTLSPSSTGSIADVSTGKIPGGTYGITARYAGDANNYPSTSTPVNVSITPEGSQTYLGEIGGGAFTIAPLPVGYGDPLRIGIIVAGNSGIGYPSGKVSLLVDGKPATTVSLDAGTGTLTPDSLTLNYGENSPILSPGVTTLSQASTVSYFPTYFSGSSQIIHAGAHVLQASYPGDPSFGASTSNSYSFTVTKVDTLIADFFPSGTAAVNIPVHLMGEIALRTDRGWGPYTGTVTITDTTTGSGVVLGSAPVSMTYGGSYDIPVTFTSAGTHTVVVSFSGDSDTNPSSATYNNMHVQSTVHPSLSVSANLTSANVGSPVTFTARVSSSVRAYTATGSVTFLDGTTSLGTATLDGTGAGSLVVQTLTAGTHKISASYAGDSVLTSSVSGSITEMIADFTMQAQPATLTISAGSSGTSTLSVIPLGGSKQTVTYTCGTLPGNLTCSFSPASVTLDGTNPGSVTVTVSASTATASSGKRRSLWGAASTLAVGWFLVPFSRRKRWKPLLGLCMLLALTLAGVGCAGTSTVPTPKPAVTPSTYVINITANGGAGTTAKTTPLVVTVTH
jgi:hypothetical protein